MTIPETFSEWFSQLDHREQKILLEYINGRYLSKPSNPLSAGSVPEATSNVSTDPETRQAVCPTCKRRL